MNTERPDAVAGGLLEGLVAIIVDGTPFVLLAPVTFLGSLSQVRIITKGMISPHFYG